MSACCEEALAFPSVDALTDGALRIENLGLVSYDVARSVQERALALRQRGLIRDTVFLCEHPATLTLGKRTSDADLTLSASEWEAIGVDIRRVDRGGRATLHLPGQLLIYPVVSLQELKIGVRQFVCDILDVLSSVSKLYAVAASADLTRPGLWCASSKKDGTKQGTCEQRKLGFVGLRVMDGVTNHGFSLNVDCELALFSRFVGCGEADVVVTSICNEALMSRPTLQEVREAVAVRLRSLWLRWRNL